ncbi:MAG: type II toxin-antitoxin system mRNA interferase toxin, RelE/StbE family [Pseudomonadales bacterium]
MWEIFEHRRVARQLNRLPDNILKRYEIWKEIIFTTGPDGLRRIRAFRDEALRGEWQGHRSSRLNQQYLLIYRIEREEVKVEVVKVNAHDYRRR